MLSVHSKANVTRHCRIFEGMRRWQIRQVILVSDIHEYSKGKVIASQGADLYAVFVLLKGDVDVWQTSAEGERKKISSFCEGDEFGEIAAHSMTLQDTEAIAVNNVQVLRVKWDNLLRIQKFFPRVSARLFQNLCKIACQRNETD